MQRFIRLTTDWLGAANVTGVYLHGSLATGSYYRPKSDIDLLIVVPDRLDGGMAAGLNLAIARRVRDLLTFAGVPTASPPQCPPGPLFFFKKHLFSSGGK